MERSTLSAVPQPMPLATSALSLAAVDCKSAHDPPQLMGQTYPEHFPAQLLIL